MKIEKLSIYIIYFLYLCSRIDKKCLRLVDSPDQTTSNRHRVSNSLIVGCSLWLDMGLWRSLQVDTEAAHFFN